MDPQHRMLLEVAWRSLEDAGIPAESVAGSETGVYVGIAGVDFAMLQSGSRDPSSLDVYSNTGGALSIAANRISYCLNLQGPSLAVDTMCSSSLTAFHAACEALRAGTCAMALAGGVNLYLHPSNFAELSAARMLSPEGRCKSFGAGANGGAQGRRFGRIGTGGDTDRRRLVLRRS